MELKQFVVLLVRWFWLLLLGLCLGAVTGILIARGQEPGYQAEARILVMRVPDQSSMGFAYLGDQQLSQTFSELITTQPVIDSVSNLLGINVDPSKIQIQKNPNSQIINVIVNDNKPEQSVLIANTLVKVAINRYVDLQVGQYTGLERDTRKQLVIIQDQMTDTQSQIKVLSDSIFKSQIEQIQSRMIPLQDEVSQLRQDIAKLTPANTPDKLVLQAGKQAQLDQILPLLTVYQDTYARLVVIKEPVNEGSADETNLILLKKTLEMYQQNYVDLESRLDLLLQSHSQGISNVTIIQDAYVPSDPVASRIIIYTLLMATIGLILAVVVIFIIDNFNIIFHFPTIFFPNTKLGQKTDQPATSNGEKTDQPAFSNEEKTDQPDTSNEEKTDQPAISNEEKTDQPATSNGEKTDQPDTSNEEKTDQPDTSNGEKTDQPATSNEEKTDQPAYLQWRKNGPTCYLQRRKNGPTCYLQ